MSRAEKIPKLLSDLRETRSRLDQALKDGALQRQLVADSCRVLRQTLKAVRNGTRLYDPNLPQKSRVHHAEEGLHRLTPREIEVLRLIAEGLSTKEIAHRLKISFKTAVSHRSHLLHKLGIHESASLVRLAIRAGLVSL
jgi:DNA-binding NarL/FixJ family response regulator